MSIRSPSSSASSGPSSKGYFRPSHPRTSVPCWGSIPVDLRVPSRDELCAAMDDDMGPHTTQCGIDDDDSFDGIRASCATPRNANDTSGNSTNGRKQVRLLSHTATFTQQSRYELYIYDIDACAHASGTSADFGFRETCPVLFVT